MAQFRYKAKDAPGNTVSGLVDADSVDGAVTQIMASGYTPLDIFPLVTSEQSKPGNHIPSILIHRVSGAEVIAMTRQLYDLVDSGIPLQESLIILSRQQQLHYLQDSIINICDSIRNGATFSDALTAYPSVFSNLYISMIRTGEIGGDLNTALFRLAELLELDQEIRSKVYASLLYPGMILCVGSVTLFVLFSFVIPKLTVLFEDFGGVIPMPTRILIFTGDIFARFWWVGVAMGVLVIFKFFEFKKNAYKRAGMDIFILKVPWLGSLIAEAEIGRFARVLATLIKSGVMIIPALQTAMEVLENQALKTDIGKALAMVRSGSSLKQSLEGSRYFLPDTLAVIAVGEESGRLDKVLAKLADSYHRRCLHSARVMTSLLEPLLIVALGSIVGFIVLAMLLPIFKLDFIAGG